MQLREKGKKDVVTMGWDEAQAALQTGKYAVVGGDSDVADETEREDQGNADPEPRA